MRCLKRYVAREVYVLPRDRKCRLPNPRSISVRSFMVSPGGASAPSGRQGVSAPVLGDQLFVPARRARDRRVAALPRPADVLGDIGLRWVPLGSHIGPHGQQRAVIPSRGRRRAAVPASGS